MAWRLAGMVSCESRDERGVTWWIMMSRVTQDETGGALPTLV